MAEELKWDATTIADELAAADAEFATMLGPDVEELHTIEARNPDERLGRFPCAQRRHDCRYLLDDVVLVVGCARSPGCRCGSHASAVRHEQ